MSDNKTLTGAENLNEVEQDQTGAAPCQVQASLSDFMLAVTEGRIAEAAQILRTTNPARSNQHWPMRIGHLVRYVADWQRTHPEGPLAVKPWRTQRVAVVGAGTAGLVCAGSLARESYPVTIYEGVESPGGVLRFSGAKSQLSQKVLDWELEVLKKLGVEIHCNSVVGEKLKLKDLSESMNFSAIFIATGTGLAHSLGEGHSLNPLVVGTLGGQKDRKGALIVEEGKCRGDDKPVDALEHARAGTASVIQSANAGKNGAAQIHKELTEQDSMAAKVDEEWDDFLEWCRQVEHTTHE